MPVRLDPPTEKVDTVESPGVLLVTVTSLPLGLAVKPTGKVVWQVALLIAVAKLEATPAVVEAVAKCPTVELVHAFVPLLPAVTLKFGRLVKVDEAEKADVVVSPRTVWVS